MNLLIAFCSTFIFSTFIYLIYKLDKINLKNRIYPFIDSKMASKNIIPRINLKIINSQISNEESAIKILNAAEFGDLFAIALTSGLNPRVGLEKIAKFVPQSCANLLDKALQENLFGKPLFDALDEMTNNKSIDNLKPLMKQIFLAVERGTPLVEVSRDFAKDQRNKLKNLITKQAAKKEIAMLMPIVFVVLPSVLAVAMYPALTVLQQLG